MHDGEKTMTDENESDKNEFGKNDVSPDEAQMLRAEAAELKDRLLRALADVENIRRRSEREKARCLAICDYQIRARRAGDSRQFPARHRGLPARSSRQRQSADQGRDRRSRGDRAAIARNPGSHGVKPIDTSDARFDPNLHQAIAEVAAEGKPKGSIVSTVQSGYMIGERLLRPAMVTVARGDDHRFQQSRRRPQNWTGARGSRTR